jgi:hypothetical protein
MNYIGHLQNEGKTVSQNLIVKITDIKERAKESEEIVEDMCKDIKLLDTAKRNLGGSIQIIDQYTKLMRTYDDMSDFCADRNYGAATHCLIKIDQLLKFFEEHKESEQIKEMVDWREQIIEKSKLQIKDDFTKFLEERSDLKEEKLLAACKLVEEIGVQFRNQIMFMPVGKVMEDYKQSFADS